MFVVGNLGLALPRRAGGRYHPAFLALSRCERKEALHGH